jgi:hypothetical protein
MSNKPKWYSALREKCAELFELVRLMVDESKVGNDTSALVSSVSPFDIRLVRETYKVPIDTGKVDARGKAILEDTLFPFDTLPKIRRDNNDTEKTQLNFVDILLWIISHPFEVDESNPIDSVVDTLRDKNRSATTDGDSDAVVWSGVDYSHVMANILVPNLRTRISLAQKKICTPKQKSPIEVAAEKALRDQMDKLQDREDTFSSALQMTYNAIIGMPEGEAAWKKLCDTSPEHARFNEILELRMLRAESDAAEDAESDAAEEMEVEV